jgi:Ca2+-binding RTX toxin-like protein
MSGGLGNDYLAGLAGNDTIDAAGGNDFIDGGTGADTMRGGTGDDTYVVDNGGMPSLGWLASLLDDFFPGISALIRGDVVVENANEGTDTVLSSISFTLPTNVENLVLSGSSNFDGTGNALSNVITENSADNTLNGLAGGDILIGGDGNDGLIGGADADTLTGGPGSDRFVLTAVSDSTVAAPDTIVGFGHGEDLIDLSSIDANSNQGGDQAFAFGGENTTVVTNGVTWLESEGNTIVQADVNGDANADLQIILTGIGHNLAATDLIL